MSPGSLERLNCLAEEVGSFIEYWGFKKIHGKIWTHLYLSPEPLDASELMKRLGISKSLASITIKDLLHFNVILQKGRGPRDTQVYAANPNIREVILEVIKNREIKMLSKASEGFAEFMNHVESTNEAKVCCEKAKSLGVMISQANMTLGAIVGLGTVNFEELQF